MDDLLNDFLTESSENLLRIEQGMVELEQRPDDAELLASIFRAMHTIKGTCGFLGLQRLERVAHAAENVLGALRDGELSASARVVSDVLASVDIVRTILEGLEAEGCEPEGDDTELVERLNEWTASDADRSDESLDLLFHAARNHLTGSAGAPAVEGDVMDAQEESPPPSSGPVAQSGEEILERAQRAGGGVSDATLRVSVEVLDRLMNLAGELVLTRNQLNQLAAKEEESAYAAPVQQLSRVTTDLQEAVMKTRMQPIGNAWGTLPRLVRDLARASGKAIDLVMVGAETELDRQILQAIRDPLTHMIRNSADHGIEAPEVREAAGKEVRGRIELEAFHEGGHIVIEIRDDGKGLDVESIRRKAVERGLVEEAEADALPDHRVFEFIFEPGFSTARKVTSVSGRGVGMDVVRSNIESIGGTIEVESSVGVGTTFRIKIPLTLAIMSALIVGVQGCRFAVPQLGVVELVRIGSDNAHLLEEVNGARFYRLRDQLLPLVRLDRVLGLDEREDVAHVLVCQVGGSRFGLVVDEILDAQEIVVKPVGRLAKHVHAYAGTTILGDGSVIMILDIPAIGLAAGVIARSQKARVDDADTKHGGGDEAEGTSLLVFDAGRDAPQAVPLARVSRLEEFPVDALEWADGRWVVQYRGSLMPVLPASPHIEMRAVDPRPVIVFSDGARNFGLAVDAIRDIVRGTVTVREESRTPGLLGAIVVAGRTTEVLDLDHYAAGAFGSEEGGPRGGQTSTANGTRRVLLVDDSPFFLNMLGPVLRSEGFQVSVSHDGHDALRRLERGERFDVVVSDIDMPGMDGLELARKVRAAGGEGLPLVALTSRGSARDREAGLAAGFDTYLVKFDRDEVLDVVRRLMGAEASSPQPADAEVEA